jgi:hypothetical protein
MADARVRRGRDDPGVNPTLARTLVALTYPLRLAAHLTQPSAPARRAQVVVVRPDED